MSKSFFYLLGFVVMVVACSTKKDQRDYSLIPPHGGILLRGERYHVELVHEENELSIYTLQELEAGAMKVIPTDSSKIYARYRPTRSKANWGLNLEKKDARYIGEVSQAKRGDYLIYLDLNVGGQKERFSHQMMVNTNLAKK